MHSQRQSALLPWSHHRQGLIRYHGDPAGLPGALTATAPTRALMHAENTWPLGPIGVASATSYEAGQVA
jgi:hypothetical protein